VGERAFVPPVFYEPETSIPT